MTSVIPQASMVTPDSRDQRTSEHTDGETRLTHQAAAIYIVTKLYDEARKEAAPAKTLDDIADALPDVLARSFREANIAPDVTAAVLPEAAKLLWAYIVVEHGRAESGEDVGFIFDLLADSLKHGTDPQVVKSEVPRVVARLRTESAVAAAEDAITKAVAASLAGLTTHPRDRAEQLHRAIDDVSAEHLARPDVGDMPLKEAQGAEAFSTAIEAMERALSLSDSPARTRRALRNWVDMMAAEAGA
ncbi:hypothetical protein ACIP79_08225 [Streptomyces sp. NPDC088747]|uniref:hypothetical protein n=1 Tax=Streptomyces sp. NPDC088747 TaxID=3365886 RepID=UPI0037F69AE9